MRRLIYSTEALAELPVGALVQAHCRVSGVPGEVQLIARQPSGWYGAWGWEHPIEPGLIVPCTVISVESVRVVDPVRES